MCAIRNPGVTLTQAAQGGSGAIESYSGPQAAAPASFMPLAPSVMYPYPVRPPKAPPHNSHERPCPSCDRLSASYLYLWLLEDTLQATRPCTVFEKLSSNHAWGEWTWKQEDSKGHECLLQAGIAASQGAFASYRQLRNETQLYAINMQFSGGQVLSFHSFLPCSSVALHRSSS